MKILKLTAENLKKLIAVEITPTGEMVTISGRNGAGKTSVLDAIWFALAGTTHIQVMPIRKGQTKARIRLDLGDLIVERRFTEKGSALTVENAQGARYTSPQGILDALLGALTFDPLAFVNQDPREQFETLRAIAPLEVDLDQLDGLNRRDFDSRTQINRDAKALRAQADGITGKDGLGEPVSTDALMDEMASASKVNADIETRKGRREAAAREMKGKRDGAAGLSDRAAQLREEAHRLEAQARGMNAEAGALQEKLDKAEPLPEPVDVDALRVRLQAAQATNRQIEQRDRKSSLLADAAKFEAQAKALTETMEAREQAKADAIAKAAVPVAGLGFGDGIVTYEGVPFSQASSAEQLKVSVGIAMAANPKLRVLRIKEGSLLDDDGIALIAEMAKAHDYQVWIEKVDTSGKIGVFIEDGQVVAVDGEPVPALAPAAGDPA